MTEKKGGRRRSHDVTPGGFLVRLVAAMALVFATYNPTDLSYYDWVSNAFANSELGAVHFLAGVLLIIGWTIFGVASFRSLGPLGLVLGAAFLAALVWVLIEYDILKLQSASSVTWVVLVCMSALLAIGVSWSHIWRRMTGQLEVDED